MRFDWEAFKNKKIAVHVKTKEESDNFLEKAKKQGLNIDDVLWDTYKEYTCYRCSWKHNDLYYGSIGFYEDNNYRIIEWSNYTEEKFTQDDLSDYMLVVTRDGEKWIVTKDVTILSGEESEFISLSNYNNFENRYNSKYDIVEVYSEREFGNPIVFIKDGRKLLYKEEEVEEMTLSEIGKILGKKIKIIMED